MSLISINMLEGKVKKSEFIVGIDLGTTNSLVAYILDGQPTAIKDHHSKNSLVPSIVHFDQNSAVVVGSQAREQLLIDPENTIYSVKRLMGKTYEDMLSLEHILGYKIIDEDKDALIKVRVRDRFYSPIELSAEILKALKANAENALNTFIQKAVITVPAYFNDVQRQATRDAGRLAGLEVLRIINEPTAASLAYGLGIDKNEERIIAVYDLGGGTFDISILHIHKGIFEVLSTNGNTFLGGDDMDKAIIDHWLGKHGISLIDLQNNKKLAQEMRIQAENAKKALSSSETWEGKLQGANLSLDRKTFKVLVSPIIEQTITCCRAAVKDAKLSLDEISNVILVGGATRIPEVRRQVAEFFQNDVFDKLNPDEVVALGAAIQADILAGNQKELLLIDVTPLSLGIETLGGLMDVLIPRNSKIPIKLARRYTTSVDGQKNLRVSVYQGERDLVEHNRKISEFLLENIPPMPAGIPKIEIQFLINADGILVVKAKELRSNTETQIKVKPSQGITEEQMGKMLKDSLLNAQKDMQQRSLLEAINEANSLILAAKKFLEQNGDALSEGEVKSFLELSKRLEDAVEARDKDKINVGMDELNCFSNPLAHEAMDRTIATSLKGKTL